MCAIPGANKFLLSWLLKHIWMSTFIDMHWSGFALVSLHGFTFLSAQINPEKSRLTRLRNQWGKSPVTTLSSRCHKNDHDNFFGEHCALAI